MFAFIIHMAHFLSFAIKLVVKRLTHQIICDYGDKFCIIIVVKVICAKIAHTGLQYN